ncbi:MULTISPECIES: DUF6884 domain-containing protein [unclassified Coleofasciculus]|uniref:DUF6884 domain-containing protein n=1 Tax=unclassified Coleofasciculus TaxID=2692782 RepID=UPI0018805B63|nr:MULTISPECIES: DUF6884 domain-containing protein [unclassified Coleofasciculus]MBE9125377.1 hypothetical protein [Coleofasciculus sp. LEGE 07081]MBE9147406.1 hypothetical protein [Coleofasciculus sp. LEGE 07092]
MSLTDPSLLILACSQRKRSDPGLLPAIIRYDGPTFRLLRRFLAHQASHSRAISVYILSAEFGLISDDREIPYYDRRMTRMRSHQLQPKVVAELENILSFSSYQELFICVGRDYLQALDGYKAIIPEGLGVRIATGSLGKKLSELHYWLYGELAKQYHSSPVVAPKGKAHLKGIEVALTPAQVLDIAHQALAEGKGKPFSYQSWYVLIDGQRVSPKWLVSQLTGLPVSDFHSIAARRMLIQLGIEVRYE